MLELMDWFCGAGGSSQGAHAVPGVRVARAANHWDLAIESHSRNFPATDHYLGDIRTAPVHRWPVADLLWASPECPQWSSARGARRDFHNTLQVDLLELPRDEAAERSRALMEEVPQYLRGVIDRGGRVRAGIVENVIEVRAWDQWTRWVTEIRALGYKTKLIAMNSMHAQPVLTPPAPQSRDRLYLAYWDTTLGREPDWDKWLRPLAYCTGCDEWVQALQVFKQPNADMGRYRQQYLYRCPHVRCRNTILEPPALPAAAAIDWSLEGTRIGDRAKPLADKTMERIQVGLRRYATVMPMMVPAGGTWRDQAMPITSPMSARTTRENDGLAVPAPFLALLRSDRPRTIGLDEPLATVVADGSNHALVVPPLLVPTEGRDGKDAVPATFPMRTQTTRAETAVAFWPFIAELRGGSSDARPVTEALATITASGNHHGLVTPAVNAFGTQWDSMLLPYYGRCAARPITDPMCTVPTRGHFALVDSVAELDIADVRFRMLEPQEISSAMAFGSSYVVLGTKRERVRQLGNAVTPPVAEILISALVEAVTGEELDRWPSAPTPHDRTAAPTRSQPLAA
ncbi:DNA cytosine methyltransferase [Nocardia arthritidis]|uniref:DNA (cytosine-5-)-methyltransferase n=1 Tax=Nocardia arthritidis TaxID=228602 RepID=A0A6G9Y9Y5_9NOCA|nr:DNA cytosine methyltransferase [Nocardia arthritidis]QIS09887.1 DNA cytosine methyltransferase [Nocardia arthritidis]